MTLSIPTSILRRITSALGSKDEDEEGYKDWYRWYDYKFAMALKAEGWKLLEIPVKDWEVIKMFRSWEQMPITAPSPLVPNLWPEQTFIVPIDFHVDSEKEIRIEHPYGEDDLPIAKQGRTIPTNDSHQTKKKRLRSTKQDRS